VALDLHGRPRDIQPGDVLADWSTDAVVRHVRRAGRWPWSAYLFRTTGGREIRVNPWNALIVNRPSQPEVGG
jgi:hypothetical protein